MNYRQKVEAKIGRPIGPKIGSIKRDDGSTWEQFYLPEHAGKSQDVIFVKVPTFLERIKQIIKGEW